MNTSMISYTLGLVVKLEGFLLMLSALVGLIYWEKAGWSFVITIVLCLLIGFGLTRKKPESKVFYVKEGFVIVALSWIVLSLLGSLPFVLSGSIKNPIDAVFETVSGFTTTGASILAEVESLPRCIIFWRSFTHWIGGMGVLVFLLTILPMDGGSYMNLMKAESPGPSVSRLVPTVKSTAKILYEIYIGMTILQIILLLLGKMPLFDALTLSFGAAGTGGFGIKNDSIAGYSGYAQTVITIFMILFGVNFNVYFFLLMGKVKQAFQIEELRWYLFIIAASIAVITVDILGIHGGVRESLHHAAFQVGSIITTTGYSTVDFNVWPQLSRTILVMLMFVGACAGSTGGGIKVSRFIILLKSMRKELHQFLHPKSVQKIKMDGKTVEHEVVRMTNVFMVAYILIFSFSILLIALDEKDLVTNFTAVTATINNIGPGLELVGPAANFSVFSNPAKVILTFDMLAGRLEIFPILLLFVRDTWKKF